MNTQAIERIKGYCCEVTQEQWEELVRVADEVGCDVGEYVRVWSIEYDKVFAAIGRIGNYISLLSTSDNLTEIPFPDFLAKLRGWDDEGDPFTAEQTLAMAAKACADKWQPKVGDDVQISFDDGETWVSAKFIGMNDHEHVCYTPWSHLLYQGVGFIRPARLEMTKEVAEERFGIKIVENP